MACVYFLQARSRSGQRIKIGRTGHCPYRRLRELRRSFRQYHSYELLGYIPTSAPVRDEAALKRRFKRLKEKGEFYRSDKALRDYIRLKAEIHICSPRCFIRTLEDKATDERYAAFNAYLEQQMVENYALCQQCSKEMDAKRAASASKPAKESKAPAPGRTSASRKRDCKEV